MNQNKIGFANTVENEKISTSNIQPEDLVQFGFIPELIGRLPVLGPLDYLTKDALLSILTVPQNSLVKQYQKLFLLEGVKLDFTDEALSAIVDIAEERKTGARALRSVMEKVMLDIRYEIPSSKNIKSCTITKSTVINGAQPIFKKLKKIA